MGAGISSGGSMQASLQELELRSFRDGDAGAVLRLHDLALERAGAHGGRRGSTRAPATVRPAGGRWADSSWSTTSSSWARIAPHRADRRRALVVSRLSQPHPAIGSARGSGSLLRGTRGRPARSSCDLPCRRQRADGGPDPRHDQLLAPLASGGGEARRLLPGGRAGPDRPWRFGYAEG